MKQLLLIITLFASLVACNKSMDSSGETSGNQAPESEENPLKAGIVGYWSNLRSYPSDKTASVKTLQLNTDGTFKILHKTTYNSVSPVVTYYRTTEGTYTIDADKIIFSVSAETCHDANLTYRQISLNVGSGSEMNLIFAEMNWNEYFMRMDANSMGMIGNEYLDVKCNRVY